MGWAPSMVPIVAQLLSQPLRSGARCTTAKDTLGDSSDIRLQDK